MTLQLIDIFSIACLIATTILFYFILKPDEDETDFTAAYGFSLFIGGLYRAMLLIPVLAIWAVYFFVRWIFKI